MARYVQGNIPSRVPRGNVVLYSSYLSLHGFVYIMNDFLYGNLGFYFVWREGYGKFRRLYCLIRENVFFM